MIQLRRVVGVSMLPTYKTGQLVVLSPLVKPRIGSVVIAIQGGKEVLKRVQSIDHNLHFELIGDNLQHSTDSRHYGKVHINKIIGVVIWPKR